MKYLYVLLGILLLPVCVVLNIICLLFTVLIIPAAYIPVLGKIITPVGGLFYGLATYSALPWLILKEVRVKLDQDGIEIFKLKKHVKTISWSEVEKIRYEFDPPWCYFNLILKSGEKQRLDNVDRDILLELAMQNNIDVEDLEKPKIRPS